jgi:hypothetical protein
MGIITQARMVHAVSLPEIRAAQQSSAAGEQPYRTPSQACKRTGIGHGKKEQLHRPRNKVEIANNLFVRLGVPD